MAQAVMMGGGIIQAVGALREGQAGEASANYNADAALQNASQSRAQAAEEERRTRQMGQKALGDIRASYGASGVMMEGSPLDVLASSAANAELDALSVRHAGEMKARGFENEARLERFKGKFAREQSYYNAASALLNSGSKAAMTRTG